MLLLAFILYNISTSGIASPVVSSFNYNNLASFPRDADTPNPCHRKRLEIIWSCLATILAASWVSVHPNLPHPQDSWLRKTLRRVELMLWALVIPELVILWAMRQWYGARQMEREFFVNTYERKTYGPQPKPSSRSGHRYESISGMVAPSHVAPSADPDNDHSIRHGYPPNKEVGDGFKWTRTHGFFLQMGGFVLDEPGKNKKQIIGWNTLMYHYTNGRLDLSNVTEAAINDRSKADGLAKGIALLQTTWFIIQCIARLADDSLTLTELELVTASLAILSLVMYFLWWDKPFNVEIPIVLTLRNSETDNSEDNGPERRKKKVKERSHFMEVKNPAHAFKLLWQRIWAMISEYNVSQDSDPLHNQEISVVKVPTFYSIQPDSKLDYYQILLASFSIASLFGLIHCAGWSSKFVFSSHTTSILWKTSSVIITASPLVCGLFFIATYGFGSEYYDASYCQEELDCLFALYWCFTIPTIPLYFVARIMILVLSLVELRDIPPGALTTIQWSNFVPFIH